MKLYVWGTGCGAGDLIDEALPPEKIEAFVERGGGGSFLGRPVIAPEKLKARRAESPEGCRTMLLIRRSDRHSRACLHEKVLTGTAARALTKRF